MAEAAGVPRERVVGVVLALGHPAARYRRLVPRRPFGATVSSPTTDSRFSP
jgi:hypothetical protein